MSRDSERNEQHQRVYNIYIIGGLAEEIKLKQQLCEEITSKNFL